MGREYALIIVTPVQIGKAGEVRIEEEVLGSARTVGAGFGATDGISSQIPREGEWHNPFLTQPPLVPLENIPNSRC